MTDLIRASQLSIEALVTGGSEAASQQVVTAIIDTIPSEVSAQQELLVLANFVPLSRAAQEYLNALITLGDARAAQFFIDYLAWEGYPTMPAIYPTLVGLTFDVIKRPIFYTASATSASGYNNRVSYSNTPTWEWELTYEYLPDQAPVTTGIDGVTGTTILPGDIKTLLGFYLAMQGPMIPFLFKDPDDYIVAAQPLGIGDGTNSHFQFVRTYGYGETGTEPVGWVDTSSVVNVYVGGALQDPSAYTIDQTFPVNNILRLHSSPANGAVITADFKFFYYVRFKETQNDFNKFMSLLWGAKKVTLASLRG